MATVRIPSVLRKHTGGVGRVDAPGETLREVVTSLVDAHPGLGDEILDGDDLRGFINVYVDDEDVRYLDGLDTKLTADSEVAILPAVAGGAA